jgi:hypothetical protein
MTGLQMQRRPDRPAMDADPAHGPPRRLARVSVPGRAKRTSGARAPRRHGGARAGHAPSTLPPAANAAAFDAAGVVRALAPSDDQFRRPPPPRDAPLAQPTPLRLAPQLLPRYHALGALR